MEISIFGATGRTDQPLIEQGLGDTAARSNVAEFVLDCLEADLYVGEMPKIADE